MTFRARLLSAMLLALPASAGADAMEVTYSIVPEILFLGSPGTPASNASGQLTIRYTAMGSAPQSSTGSGFTAIPGPALVLGGQLSVTVTTYYPPTGMALSGHRLGIRVGLGPGAGSLNRAGDLVLPLLNNSATLSNHCAGVGCDYSTVSIPQTGMFANTFNWSAAAHLGTSLHPDALVGLTLPVNIPVFSVRITTATEISRHFLPEPSYELGLTSGAAARTALLGA